MRRTSEVSSRLLEGLAIVGPSLWKAPCLVAVLYFQRRVFSLAFSKTSGSTPPGEGRCIVEHRALETVKNRLKRMVLIVSSIRISALDRMSPEPPHLSILLDAMTRTRVPLLSGKSVRLVCLDLGPRQESGLILSPAQDCSGNRIFSQKPSEPASEHVESSSLTNEPL
jgi:hypothetical protein